MKHISTIFTHLFSVLFALSAASSRSRRLGVMRVGEAAVWLAAAAAMVVNVREIHFYMKKWEISIISAHLFSISVAFPATLDPSIAAEEVGLGVSIVLLTSATVPGASV
jgi:hypothetical protein